MNFTGGKSEAEMSRGKCPRTVSVAWKERSPYCLSGSNWRACILRKSTSCLDTALVAFYTVQTGWELANSFLHLRFLGQVSLVAE